MQLALPVPGADESSVRAPFAAVPAVRCRATPTRRFAARVVAAGVALPVLVALSCGAARADETTVAGSDAGVPSDESTVVDSTTGEPTVGGRTSVDGTSGERTGGEGNAAGEPFVPRFAERSGTIELADAVLSPLERQFVDVQHELRVAVQRGGLPPYWTVGPDGEIGGHAIDLLQTLAATVGFRLVPRVYDTWPEVMDALRDRRADVIPVAEYSLERSAYLDFTPGVFPDPVGLIGRAGDTRFDDDALAGVRVAVVRGYLVERQLKLLYPAATAVPVDDPADALDLLEGGEVDLYLDSIVPTVTAAEARGDLPLRVVRPVYFGTGWLHVVSRSDWPVVGQVFDRFLGAGRARIARELADDIEPLASADTAPLALTDADASLLAGYESLRLGALSGLPMLNGVTANGTHIGIASGFSAYLAYQFGLPTEIVRYESTAEMLAGAESGEIDLVPLLAPSPGQRERFALSTPYLEIPWLLVGRDDQAYGSTLDRFAGGRLGMRRDHPLKALIEREHPDITIVDYATPRELLQDLVGRDVDVALMSRLVALPLIGQSFLGEVHSLGEFDGPPAAFSFAAPAGNADLMPLVDRALAGMDPVLAERIVNRWAAVDFEPAAELRQRLRILVPLALGLGALALAVIGWNRRLAAESRRRLLAERRLIDMTEGLRTGVFQMEQERGGVPRFVFANTLAKRMARLPETGPAPTGLDLPFFEHVHPDERERVIAGMRACTLTGETFRETFRFELPDGEEGWILAEATARAEPDGTRLWNGHLFDLTEERRLSERLGGLLATKKEFVAAAGHELRAPVQSVSLALEALGTSPLDATQAERLQMARQGVEDLSELVDDLLDIARLDAHELPLRETPVRLGELFAAAGRTLEGAIRDKGLRFECRVDPALPPLVLVDPVRLRQVLHNLVGNATKYTDTGGIVLAVSVEEGAAGPRDVVVEVRDSGIGIPTERLAKIFDPFSAVGPVKRRGTGLGLAICRRLVDMMGGDIRVESEVGRGSTFRVRLPLVPVRADGATDAAPRADGARRTAPEREGRSVPPPADVAPAGRALLVEDDRRVRTTLASLLRHRGFEIDEAGDAAEALGLLDERAYGVVLTDLRMPGMNGVELGRVIRRRGGVHTLVGMTGGLSEEGAERANEVFDIVLIKPVSAAEVSDALGAHRPSPSASGAAGDAATA